MSRRSAPSGLLYATEVPRAVGELAAWPLTAALSAAAPTADGRPVLVLPGLLAGDASTEALRRFLRRCGSSVHRWNLGRNLGPTPKVQAGLRSLVSRLADEHDQPVALVGWSLGGVYARTVAAERPTLVSQVITLGTPFAVRDRSQARASATYERLTQLRAATPRGAPEPPLPAAATGPLPVPSSSIWSRQDGIVSWRASLEKSSATAENIAVVSSHLGLGRHPAVLWAVADRLAQAPGHWTPYVPPTWLRALYRSADDGF